MSHRRPRLDAFERLIVHAVKQRLCCDLACTTCGATEFVARGLLLLTRGVTPGQKHWRELARAAQDQWSLQHFEFSPFDQELLVTRARTACFARITAAAGAKEWLPYVGVFVRMVRAHEEEHSQLARAWRQQFREMFEYPHYSRYEFTTGPLTQEEVESYQHCAPRLPAREASPET